MKYVAINCKLKEWLAIRGYRQKDLAYKTGLSAQYISDIVNNRQRMTMNNAMSISKTLNISIEELYEWKTEDPYEQ